MANFEIQTVHLNLYPYTDNLTCSIAHVKEKRESVYATSVRSHYLVNATRISSISDIHPFVASLFNNVHVVFAKMKTSSVISKH